MYKNLLVRSSILFLEKELHLYNQQVKRRPEPMRVWGIMYDFTLRFTKQEEATYISTVEETTAIKN